MKSAIRILAIFIMMLFSSKQLRAQAGCNPSTAQADLDINNVRTTILVGGDMWWDLLNPKYEIPKGSGKNSLYAGALWIGGVDNGGQIRVAAQTYRQFGNDFWGGPIDTFAVGTTAQNCLKYDRLWKVTRQEVQNFINDPSTATNDIKNWPGTGSEIFNEGHYLAPFVDVNNDGEYDYTKGDYPGYNLTGSVPVNNSPCKASCNDYLFGDQTIWWVFNDIGNIHTSSGSPNKIGLEIRAQAFAFQTNDEINNMTFYKYQIINRSNSTLTDTYFGQWVDPDLGYSDDDYVGCDVGRGLGFCYNGDADDETASGYGLNPPAIGVDFFQGPVADIGDGIDNDHDGCIDCTFITDSTGTVQTIPDSQCSEQIIMSKFVYYVNTNNVPNGNPNAYTDFYNYLRGYWLDNQPITYGGDGRDPSSPVTSYMFPDNTDPSFPGQTWSESSVNNPVGDRRFIQSAGTFTLYPGAVNYITTGVVWARASSGGPLASVQLMKQADDKAQALFNNCFKLIDGPDAPDITIRELDKKLIVSIINSDTASVESYHQKDPTIVNYPDSLTYYNFQGYQIFQFKDGTVTVADIGNVDKVRLVAQVDIKDGIGQLVNFNYDPSLNANIPVEKVNGADAGIAHSFEITKDLFASGNTSLVNHKTYYYTVISYASNIYKKYDPSDPLSLDGQKKPYLAGRNNVKTYTGIPHISAPENNGITLNSSYGDGLSVTRIEGQGNGGYILDMSDHSVDEILTPPVYRSRYPEYLPYHSPVLVKVVDPVKVKTNSFEQKFDGVENQSHYSITNINNQSSVYSDYSITEQNEQLLPEWGISVSNVTAYEPGDVSDPNNGFLEGTIQFADPSLKWLSAVKDVDSPATSSENWIRSGNAANDPYPTLDDQQIYEHVISGTWAPYKLCSKDPNGPKWASLGEALITLSPTVSTKTAVSSIDVVFTNDQSKWSRAAVVELGSASAATIGNAKQYELRKSSSIGKDGSPDASISQQSMSWFPGYAYNVETGERLNIIFGENSIYHDENGQDMKFNPTKNVYDSNGNAVLGGMHFIYVMGHNGDGTTDVPAYDSCRYIYEKLSSGNPADKRAVWKNAMWVNIPLVAPGYENLDLPTQIPTDVKVRLRVGKKFRTYATSDIIKNTDLLNPGTTYYVASTPVVHNGITYTNPGASFTAATTSFTGDGTLTLAPPLNNFNPYYSFSSNSFGSVENQVQVAKDALDLINVVPNPYFAYSSYETSQLDTKIKIVNLPPKCTISIFTQSGTLVRKIKRDVSPLNTPGAVLSPKTTNGETSADWDLKNESGIPIASGMYLIHIEAPGLGAKTLKWFGLLRPLDLDTF